ncbi:GNAT family N-acetyltransferase [Streptomyces sp. YC537]|uniref:GNAT family N-acetyltransferase n=2 Tax=Streptomyces boluensis TaxID=1775135 RepID=A0A964V1U8_9ACTN|nr:GNAT family N-acetyltransferase [Streptomyces boluensis]
MQGLAQRVTALRPDLVNGDATFGELAWNWGRGHGDEGPNWRHRLWFSGGAPVAWAWARLPREAADGAYLSYQVHPGHAGLVDAVIDWYDATAAGLERTVLPSAADAFALERWAAHGYTADLAALGEHGSWTQLNERDLTDVAPPRLPDGYRFRTADEAGPEATAAAHAAAWGSSTYTADTYRGVRRAPGYRGDLHLLVEAADGTMAASTVLWLDEPNRTAEFEPLGTHPEHRRRGLARAMLLHGMRLARAAGATQATVACLGAPGHPQARELYHGTGFRELTRDAPLIRPGSTGPAGGTG